MGTTCGIIKKPELGCHQVILPLRKVAYQHLPTLSQMRMAKIGPFFRADVLSRFGDDLQKWNRMVADHEAENFPLEAYLQSTAAKNTFAKRLEKGPPPQYRWQAWIAQRKLSQKIDEFAYDSLPRSDAESETRLLREVVLLYPFEDYYHHSEIGETGRQALISVLSKFAKKHPAISVVSGLQHVAGFLLLVSGGNEVEVFYFLEDLVGDGALRGFYQGKYAYLKKCKYVFLECLRRHLPTLHNCFESNNLSDDYWVQKWLATVYSASLPLEAVVRIWDVFLVQGLRMVFKVGITLLREKQYELLNMRQKELQEFFSQPFPMPMDVEELIRKAFKVSVSVRMVAKIEGTFRSEAGVESPHSPEDELPAIVTLPRVTSVVEFKPLHVSGSQPLTAKVFTKVERRSSRGFASHGESKVPILPKLQSRNRGTVFTWNSIDYEDDSGCDDDKPLAARDVLEDLLQREESLSILSLDSLSNLPPKNSPKVDEFITFVKGLPV